MIDSKLVVILEDLPKENALNSLLMSLDLMSRDSGLLPDTAIRISLGILGEEDFENLDRNAILMRTSDGYIDT